MADNRFSKASYDPRFIKPKKDDSKLKIDARFASMLDSEEFGTSTTNAPKIDKYGRKAATNVKQDMQRFYKLDESESESDLSNASTVKLDSELEDVSESDLENMEGYQMARGEGLQESSDEESVASEDIEDDELVGPYSNENVPIGDETNRLAIVNLDWDHIKAKDLFKLFEGFKSKNGIIKSVTIYPSEFGKTRMAQEEIQGPPTEIFKSEVEGPLIQQDDGESFDNLKLRKYQLERLKYYYAILECDSVSCARHIYESCDGTEFEASANLLDLRYVPDGMTFEDTPFDQACEAPLAYHPSEFVTASLQHSKVKLTWDEDDAERQKITRRKFKRDDLKDMDFKAYLASDSDSEDAEELRSKYSSLLTDAADNTPQEDMEITFISGLSEKAADLLSKKKQEELQKDETVFEAQLRKKRENKKLRKGKKEESNDLLVNSDENEEGIDEEDPFFKLDYGSDFEKNPPKAIKKSTIPKKVSKGEPENESTSRAELELLVMDEPTSRHFDKKAILKSEKESKKKIRKRKAVTGETQDEFELDISDARFADVLNSHHFAIDPTNPQFKKTKSMNKILEMRRNQGKTESEAVMDKEEGVNSSNQEHRKLKNLIASVKSKSQKSNSIGKRK